MLYWEIASHITSNFFKIYLKESVVATATMKIDFLGRRAPSLKKLFNEETFNDIKFKITHPAYTLYSFMRNFNLTVRETTQKSLR